jgi:hypothetical protein
MSDGGGKNASKRAAFMAAARSAELVAARARLSAESGFHMSPGNVFHSELLQRHSVQDVLMDTSHSTLISVGLTDSVAKAHQLIAKYSITSVGVLEEKTDCSVFGTDGEHTHTFQMT